MTKNSYFKDLRQKAIFQHIFIWAIFVSYELLIVMFRYQSLVYGPDHYIIYYSLNIGYFYLNALFILEYCFSKSKAPYVFIILTLSGLLLYMGVKTLIDYYYMDYYPWGLRNQTERDHIISNSIRGIQFLAFAVGYSSVKYLLNYRKKLADAEKHKLEAEKNLIKAENAFLQAQINPHLLFNTLNFIYNSVRRTSAEASECIMLLSQVMQYSLEDISDDNKTDLDMEITQIENFVKLNQLRFRNQLYIETKFTGDFDNIRIPPLILLTLVENVYKHGDLTDSASPALVEIKADQEQLLFTSRNKIRPAHPLPGRSIGLSNVRTRLAAHYPERHSLETHKDGFTFFTELKLLLKEA